MEETACLASLSPEGVIKYGKVFSIVVGRIIAGVTEKLCS